MKKKNIKIHDKSDKNFYGLKKWVNVKKIDQKTWKNVEKWVIIQLKHEKYHQKFRTSNKYEWKANKIVQKNVENVWKLNKKLSNMSKVSKIDQKTRKNAEK